MQIIAANKKANFDESLIIESERKIIYRTKNKVLLIGGSIHLWTKLIMMLEMYFAVLQRVADQI